MAKEKNRYTIGCGDINPVINLIVEGSLGTQIVGEPVDLTGVTIYALHYNGKKENVTNKVRLSRSNWSDTEGNQSVDIGYKGRRITLTANVSEVMLDSISVKTPPTVTSFAAGADIDLTGLVLTATYTDGSTADVTQGYTFTPTVMANDTTSVTISYTENGVTKTTTQAVSLIANRKKVGGILFYIDSTADGTYTFYNGEGTQVAAPTVGTDCTDWEYEVTGASKDKFYIVNNEKSETKRIWGGYETLIGASGTAIGTGKTNTAIAIGSVADEVGSIWEYIRTMRTNKVGGCDDWFVGSKDELETLRTSGAGDSATWFSDKEIWSSSEYNVSRAWIWYHFSSSWVYGLSGEKTNQEYVCGVRAF